MPAYGPISLEPLNLYMVKTCLFLTYGEAPVTTEDRIREDIFRTYLKNFDEQHVMFVNSLWTDHRYLTSPRCAVNYLIGMLAVHFSDYIGASVEQTVASLVFNPFFFRDYEGCGSAGHLNAVDEALGCGGGTPGLLPRMEDKFKALECGGNWRIRRAEYFDSWWTTWEKDEPLGPGYTGSSRRFFSTSNTTNHPGSTNKDTITINTTDASQAPT